MGITIHYNFARENDPKPLLREAKERAEKAGWKILKDSIEEERTLVLLPHDDCEGVTLRFSRAKEIRNIQGWDILKDKLEHFGEMIGQEEWFSGDFTKTQFATDEVHVQVAEFLRFIGAHCFLSVVNDEADFYETQDYDKMSGSIDENAEIIDRLGKALSKEFGKDNVVRGDQLK